MTKIKNLIKKKLVILDGAMGTQLQRLGMPSGVCPEHWCLKNPDKLAAIHKEYKKAGSDIIYTATFGANRIKLKEHNLISVFKINRDLVSIAKRAAGKKTLVAGDIGPSGRLVEPFGDFKFEQAVDVFKEQVKGLLAGGVDLFVIETMIDIQEARAALLAVKELTDKFTIVSLTFEPNGFTLGGTDPLTALITLQSLGADCFGCNCSTGPESMLKIIQKIKPYAKVPLLAKPNAGLPKLRNGETIFDMKTSDFAGFLPRFFEAGINFIGGCCGTSPSYIEALKRKVKDKKPQSIARKSLAALTSARASYIFAEDKPLAVVGECINPTGKRALSSQLKRGDFSLLRDLAKVQQQAGADILDVNVSAAGVDQEKTMSEAVKLLSKDIVLPLAVDSSSPKVIERFLRIYPGRALVNSISADTKKNKKLLKLAAKYGAMFIALPLTGKCLPKNFESRKHNIEKIYKKAKEFGFSQDDLIVDGLVLSAASNPEGPGQALKTINWAKSQGFQTVLGLSNVSFGLPGRNLINCTFLNLAQNQGLDSVIANPLSEDIMRAKRAADFLINKKEAGKLFFKVLVKKKRVFVDKKGLKEPEQEVYRLILEGRKEKIKETVKRALSLGIQPYSLVDRAVVEALKHSGKLFDQKVYFLPQLIASAEAAKVAFAFLRPKLKKKNKSREKTVIVLATVKDDIHDIGKNIVALMLENHGFEVVDLGKDVSASRIINAVKSLKASLVGLSALMTTTMVNMEEVVSLAKKSNLKCKFIVGGAVVTKNYARQLGAEYASCGLSAVKVAEKLKN